uniref:Uncharacterized protein n=1 Tax=Anser brachyrhynchus TaxID=132585 RepID=A0A8B9CL35_9AVES
MSQEHWKTHKTLPTHPPKRPDKQLSSGTASQNRNFLKLYKSVIEDVIEGVRELFAEEGVDEQVLKDLKQVCWLPFH